MKTLLELLQNVEVETPLGTTDYRMITSGKLQLATLFLHEEILSPYMVIEWIVAACKTMPVLKQDQAQFTLDDLKKFKQEAGSILSNWFDYAKFSITKEQPVAYEPPHRRNSWARTWRSVGTQTSSFELTDWAQFQQFRQTGSKKND